MRPLPRRVNRETDTDKRATSTRPSGRERAREKGLDPIDDEERWLEVQEF